MKSDILLIPPVINPFFEEDRQHFLPVGLLALASGVQKCGISVQIYEPGIRLLKKNDYVRIASEILKYNSKIIGFSTWCTSYAASLLVAEQIKKQNQHIQIVFGGPQASILAYETMLEFPFVDFILAGEADLTFQLLIKAILNDNHDFSKINGLTYRNKNQRITTINLGNAIVNLDELPIPAYELAPEMKTMSLDVGRGCPFNCTYCSTNDFFSRKFRLKSVARIIQEMNSAFQKLKIKTFSMDHDMFTMNKTLIHDLCVALIHQKEKTGIKYSWSCSARIDCVDKEMLIQMSDAGCISIFFGIESGSEKIQKSIRKNLNISKVYEIAEICREAGINMHASFIIGFPDETTTDIESTLKCLIKLILNGAIVQASELSLLPGTHLFKKYNDQLKFDGNFSNFSQTICGEEELKLIIDKPKIFSSFYYLPVSSLNRKEIKSLINLINNSGNFRNTFFLLKNLFLTDLQNINLFEFFKKEHSQLPDETGKSKMSFTFWINFLKTYLINNNIRLQHPLIYDVFAFEAFNALLKVKYSNWQLMNPQNSPSVFSEDKLIKIKPVWKILITSFQLEKIIPSKNEWNIENQPKKGNYKYLLIALTEQNNIYTKLTSRDEFLLKKLKEQPVSQFLKRTKNQFSREITTNWLIRMGKLGVLNFEEA